jgi:hypothetical protein
VFFWSYQLQPRLKAFQMPLSSNMILGVKMILEDMMEGVFLVLSTTTKP